MTDKVPDYCKDCLHLYRNGIKDGKHDRHCCAFGKPAPKVVNHCKTVGGKLVRADKHMTDKTRKAE